MLLMTDSTDESEGRYANCLKVGHNPIEFVLDFGQCFEGESRENFHTRIITSPVYLKSFSKLLQEAVNEYEDAFGEIHEDA